MFSALRFPATGLELSKPEAAFSSSVIIRKPFYQAPGAVDPSKQEVFVAGFSYDPKVILNCIGQDV